MQLYEVILTTQGCSYCRFYVWCEGLDRAREIAIERTQDGKHGSIQAIQKLFSADDPEFCTQVDDEGWVP